MESSDSNEYYQNNFKRCNLKLSSGDSESDARTLESLEHVTIADNNSSGDDTKEDFIEDAVNLRNNVGNAVSINENQPALIGMGYQRYPKYERDEGQIVGNTELPDTSSLVNTRALLKEATTYELESFDKHALVIFNHFEFVYPYLEPRHGTEKDVEALTATFKNFGFEVTTHNDLKKDEVFGKLEEFSKRDFTDYGCVAVAILTHGYFNGLLWAADQPYRDIEIFKKLMVDDVNKATLVSKPKIFIIQACRGNEGSSRVPVLPSPWICTDDANHPNFYNLPLEADFLILHSSYPGRVSIRNTFAGSWFIQTLCEKINTLSLTQDLESIITEVKRDVAIDKFYYDQYWDEKKQIPVMTSTLIRKLYLKKLALAARQVVSASGVASGAASGVASGVASGAPRDATRKSVRQAAQRAARQAPW